MDPFKIAPTTLNDLPIEILSRILHFVALLDKPFALCNAGAVCRLWYNLTNDDLVWAQLCKLRWTGKKITYQLHPLADYRLCASTLSVKELKEILRLRHINTRQVFEKSELISMIQKTSPEPWPAPLRSKWKSSYFAAELDSKRSVITTEELCSIEWNMIYKEMRSKTRKILSRFFADFTFHSEALLDVAQWKFTGPDNLISVDEYPVLSTIRTADWGWELQNDFVALQVERILPSPLAPSGHTYGQPQKKTGSPDSPAPSSSSYSKPSSSS